MDVHATSGNVKDVERLMDEATDSKGRLVDDFNIELGDTRSVEKKPCAKTDAEKKQVDKAQRKADRKREKADRKAEQQERKTENKAEKAARKVLRKVDDNDKRSQADKRVDTARKTAARIKKDARKSTKAI